MAVMLNVSKEHGYEIAALCGVGPVLLDEAKQAGVSIILSANGTLTISSGSAVTGIVPFKGSAVTLLKEGKMGPASKESAKYQLEKGLKAALLLSPQQHQAADSLYDDVADISGTTTGSTGPALIMSLSAAQKAAATKKAKAMENSAQLTEPKSPPVTFNPFSGKKASVLVLPQVKLLDAQELLQPVFGTSNGAVYYAAAFFSDVKLAVRRQGATTSFRVEGDVSKYQSQLEGVGFGVKGHYASAHLETNSDGLFAKTFGAVVASIGFGALQQVADPMAVPK